MKVYRLVVSIVTALCVIAGVTFHVPHVVGNILNGTGVLDDLNIHIGFSNAAGDGMSGVVPGSEDWEFDSIDMELETLDVRVETGDEYKVECKTADQRLNPTFTVEDGVLKIKQHNKGNVFNMGSFENQLTITLPEGMKLNTITIANDMGDVYLYGLEGETAKLDVNAGDIEAQYLTLKSITAQTDAGDVELDASKIPDVHAVTNMGDVEFNDMESEKIDASTDMGDVILATIEDLSKTSINMSTDMGDVSFYGDGKGTNYSQTGTRGSITLETSMGDVKIMSINNGDDE